MNLLEHKGIRILAGLALAGLALFLVAETRNSLKAHDYIGRPMSERDTITLSADGKVVAIPDIATTSIGVTTEAKTVASAQKENTEKMNAILEKMKSLGIDEKDLRTENYSVYPLYDWRDGIRIDRGFSVNQSLLVKIRDLSKTGEALAAATELGANQVGGLNFTIDDPEALEQEARLEAIAKAQEKAQAVADAAGITLGKMVGFSETSNGQQPVYRGYALDQAIGLGGGGAPDIAEGSQDVVVNVSVTYEVIP